MNYQIDEYEENILHVEGSIEPFNIEIEEFVEEDNYCGYDSDYTQEELDDMYRAAFEGDPDAQWNID